MSELLICPECGKNKEYESEHERGLMCFECLSNEAQYPSDSLGGYTILTSINKWLHCIMLSVALGYVAFLIYLYITTGAIT